MKDMINKQNNTPLHDYGFEMELTASGILVAKGYRYCGNKHKRVQENGIDGLLDDGYNTSTVDIKEDKHVGITNNVLFEFIEDKGYKQVLGWFLYSKAKYIVFINERTKRLFRLDLACRDDVWNIAADPNKFQGVWLDRHKSDKNEGQIMLNVIIPVRYVSDYFTEL